MLWMKNGRLTIQGLLFLTCCVYNLGCRSASSQYASNSGVINRINPPVSQVSDANDQLVQPVSESVTESETVDSNMIKQAANVEVATPNQNLTLDEIKNLALKHNPAIRQAEAAVSKAVGIRHQVQLYPNPIVGYSANQLADEQTDQHTVFVEQEFVTSNKLEKNAHVLDHEVQNLKWQVEQQRRTVLADVKQQYYEVLGAQQLLELTNEFADLAFKSVDLTKQFKQIGEGTAVDLLQSEIQAQQILITQKQASANLFGAWKKLTATIGLADLNQQIVIGELPTQPVIFDWDNEYARILKESPELMAAHYRVTRSLAFLERQRVQANPNVSVSLAAGYDRATNSQLINTQIGMPIPFYNHNEGNESAAYADYCRSSQELKRIQLSLKARLAQVAQDYDSSAASVNLHRDVVIPKSQQLLELAEQSYKAGEINFLQVIVIRKTYFDARYAYISSCSSLAKARVSIEEYLLSGSLSNDADTKFDDGLRNQTFSGQ